MITSVEQLKNLPVVILMYWTGSSGEFIAHSLSQSIAQISKPPMHWENNNRCKYSDFLGRSLNAGDNIIRHEKVVERVNIFFDQVQTLGTIHIALSHFNFASVDFIRDYMPDAKVIEIVTETEESKQFKISAESKKVEPRYSGNGVNPVETSWVMVDYTAKNHLKIEWSKLLLNDTHNEFNKINEFLQTTGDISLFQNMVQDYLDRNRDLVKINHK